MNMVLSLVDTFVDKISQLVLPGLSRIRDDVHSTLEVNQITRSCAFLSKRACNAITRMCNHKNVRRIKRIYLKPSSDWGLSEYIWNQRQTEAGERISSSEEKMNLQWFLCSAGASCEPGAALILEFYGGAFKVNFGGPSYRVWWCLSLISALLKWSRASETMSIMFWKFGPSIIARTLHRHVHVVLCTKEVLCATNTDRSEPCVTS